ncbi:MAG: hypothetical protein RBS28_03780 [Rhodocyclaceae bacterium]|jgi:hypothetical protein|nr:hypothetical protein [Rhodocyclaceae bacterium]
MATTLADVLVHVNENMDEAALRNIEQDIRKDIGVISVGHRSGQTHILMVVYDSGATRAAKLLQPLRAQGLHVQVIGL